MANKSTILIIDDEKDIRESLSEILLDEGYETYLAADANEARKLIKQENNIDIILLDIWMPDCDGITLLKELKVSQKLKQPIIMMSGHGTIDTAIEATKNGAFDFIEKPISLHKVLKVLNDAINESLDFNTISIEFLKNNKDKELFDLFKKLDDKENHQFFKTNCKEALYSFLSFNKDQVFKIDQSSIKKIDNCESFLEEKKNSLIIFENFSDYNENAISIFKIIESKTKKYNVKIAINSDVDLTEEYKQKINFSDFSITDFKVFGSQDEDKLIKSAKDILTYHLNFVSNKIYKEFDITFLNKIRSDKNCYDILYLDQIIRNCLKFADGEIIDEEDYHNAIKLSPVDLNEPTKQKNNPIEHLYGMELKSAREEFDKLYLKHHLDNNVSMKDLSIVSGVERTHLYRKLKQLGLKNSK